MIEQCRHVFATLAQRRQLDANDVEAMKEEIFQLEIDRQQGKVTPEEYAKAKAALALTQPVGAGFTALQTAA